MPSAQKKHLLSALGGAGLGGVWAGQGRPQRAALGLHLSAVSPDALSRVLRQKEGQAPQRGQEGWEDILLCMRV